MSESSPAGTLQRARPFLVSTALVAVAMYLFGLVLGDFTLRVIAKPFPVLAMIAFVATRRSSYARGIAIGLAFCLLGDVLLEFRNRFFLPGMIAFLLGHVAYATAFLRRAKPIAAHLAVPFGVWIFWALYTLWDGLGAMQVPVAAYTVAIFVMMWRAAAMVSAQARPRTWDWAAVAGAVLFGFSDTLIALDRFGDPIDGVRVPIILTYWAAQLLITSSALGVDDEE